MDRILFNGFYIPFLPKLNYFKDGEGISTVLFIVEPEEQFVISMEEGMKCIDLTVQNRGRQRYIHAEHEQENKYLHQCRMDSRKTIRKKQRDDFCRMAFFHIRVQDQDGNTRLCPGQISVAPGYEWNDGVEPVLLALMEGITVADH